MGYCTLSQGVVYHEGINEHDNGIKWGTVHSPKELCTMKE